MKNTGMKLVTSCIISATIVAAATATASEVEGWACEAEMATGFHYTRSIGWTSTAFAPLLTFVVKRPDELQKDYLAQYPHIYGEGVEWIAVLSEVDLHEGEWFLSRWTQGCKRRGNVIQCRGPEDSTRMNIETMRFISVYELGYINGHDLEGTSPHMSGGLCQLLK